MTGDYVTKAEFNAAVALLATKEDLHGLEGRVDGLDVRLERVEVRLANVEVRLENFEERLGNVEVRLANVEVRLADVEVRLERVEDRLDRLDAKLDAKVEELKHFFELTADRFRDECRVLHDGYRAQAEKHDALMREFRVHEQQQNERFERVDANLYLLNTKTGLKLPGSLS